MTTPTSTPRSASYGPWIALAITALVFAVALVLYPRMPETVPTHWNAWGEVDGTMPKHIGAFIGPGTCAFVLLLYVALPRLSGKGMELERFQGAYDAIMLALVGAMAVISITVSLAEVGYEMPTLPIVGCAIGVLFAVLGNFMGKVQRNAFVGIRTPWTLSNEEVWLRTHRLAGKLFVAGGVVMAVSSFFGPAIIVGVLLAVGLSFVPIVYSYVLHRRLEG
ncbi:MAG: SdpI family protein [Sandaracinaceae bacterium]|nr:SdpI family protein [Sandaracinaceae bacterium]